MVGYSEMKEVVIWLQTEKEASVFIEYYGTDEKTTILRSESY